MTILGLQRRLRQIGRIRIGEKVPSSNGRTRPSKLQSFRFTSKDKAVVEAAAELYGGEVSAFTEELSDDRWQVTTKADQLAIIIPPGEAGFSQFYESWSKGGCQRRCDGATELLSDKPCLCLGEIETGETAERTCKPHTRVSVMLADLRGLGVWRIDSQGYYAATELAGAVDVCAAATARGVMLPARLRLEQRSVKRMVDGRPQTFRFAVPCLDVDVPLGAFLNGALTGGVALAGLPVAPPAVAALEAGPSFTPIDVDALPEGPAPSIADQLAAVGEPKARPARKNAATPIPPTGVKPKARGAQSSPPAVPTGGDGEAAGGASGTALQEDSPRREFTIDQRLAKKATEAGIDEETRHALVSLLTKGRTGSGKDVTEEEAASLFSLYHLFGEGTVEVAFAGAKGEFCLHSLVTDDYMLPVVGDDGHLSLTVPPRLQRVPAGTETGTVPGEESPQPPAPSPEPVTGSLREMAKTAGVNGNKLLSQAARFARAMNLPVPQNLDVLDDADPALLERLRAWVAGEGDPEGPM